MNKKMIILATAYSYVVSGKLSDKQRNILEKYNIDFKDLNQYIEQIRNNSLSINDQEELERLFNIDLSTLNNSSNDMSNNNNKSNSKQMVLSNGKKQLYNDEAAFSDIYMFGFLVLLFQVLFLIISYLIFAK